MLIYSAINRLEFDLNTLELLRVYNKHNILKMVTWIGLWLDLYTVGHQINGLEVKRSHARPEVP